jgi:hypothetical protein
VDNGLSPLSAAAAGASDVRNVSIEEKVVESDLLSPHANTASLREPQWNPKTPTTAGEVEAQSTLFHDRIQRHQGSSPTPMMEIVDQLQRHTAMLLHGQTLLAARVLQLEASNKAASERKSRKRKRIQKGGDLSKEQAEGLKAQCDVGAQSKGETHESRARTGASKRGKRHCKRCGETGHNSRTCKKGVVDVSD